MCPNKSIKQLVLVDFQKIKKFYKVTKRMILDIVE